MKPNILIGAAIGLLVGIVLAACGLSVGDPMWWVGAIALNALANIWIAVRAE